MTPTKPRPEVIAQLSTEALSAIEEAGVIDLTAAEVCSVCFTITQRVTKLMIEVDDRADRAHNIEQITNAIGALYALIPQKTIH